eukprot:maker-scaffold_19-snap-gene-6.2-mRNA-1 protein AED:0.00 eAED:0.00 QI:51/1/1/1/1/1/2/189/208
MSQQNQLSTVFIGNIPYEVDLPTLKNFMSEVGEVKSLRFVIDKETKKPKGFGFCEFNTPEEARAAIIRFDGFTLHGRKIKVDSADGTNNNNASPNNANKTSNSAIDEELDTIISEFGTQELCEILLDYKRFINEDAHAAKRLLFQRPEIAHALQRIVFGLEGLRQRKDEAAQRERILRQVVQLTPEQIMNLPEKERQKVMEILREQNA